MRVRLGVPSRPALFSFYRVFLRQIRQLPHIYLRYAQYAGSVARSLSSRRNATITREFFRLKASDDVRKVAEARKTHTRNSIFRRVHKDYRRISRAMSGNHKAFSAMLDIAYGRVGRLRWEMMKPLLTDPKQPLPPRIIASSEKSRPPVYSSELKALHTSALSRTTWKALKDSSLRAPPTLPERANPNSEEAKLLGRLSKRREVNARWRYFTREWKKVYPPLSVYVKAGSDDLSTDDGALKSAGIRPIGLQDGRILEEIRALASQGRRLHRGSSQKQDKKLREATSSIAATFDPCLLPVRWLRRRYQELLSRIPILTYTYSPDHPNRKGIYSVSVSDEAISQRQRFTGKRLPYVDETDIAWIGTTQLEKLNKNQKK